MPYESIPAAFPKVAKADGEPGPNTCRLVQAVIFVQPAKRSPACIGGPRRYRRALNQPELTLLNRAYSEALARAQHEDENERNPSHWFAVRLHPQRE